MLIRVLENIKRLKIKQIITFELSIVVFIVSYFVFKSLTYHYQSAIGMHASLLALYIKYNSFPSYSIYYFFLYLFSGFKTDYWALIKASIVLLSLFVVVKFIITKYIANEYFKLKNKPVNNYRFLFLFVLFVLVFIHPFLIQFDVSKNLYLGFIAPNIWHNSTYIFMVPFALVLFIYSYKYLLEPNRLNYSVVLFLSILNIIVKPSFFFVFALTFPIIVFYKYKLSKAFLNSIVIVTIGAIVLFLYTYWLYNDRVLIDIYQQGATSGIAFSFCFEWKNISKNISRDFILSSAFPLMFLFFYYKKALKSVFYLYTVLIFIIGMLIWIFIHETGCRTGAANFIWQANLSNFILYLSSALLFWDIQEEKKFNLSWKDLVIINVFIWQMLSGFVYTYKLLYVNDFL